MSGIFKGDSIYKNGGGSGGGYKDGGELVDGDFIKVENNTVSSYDNVSRDPVNFYFEVKDGEILNSVVELTTAVNATINVYVLKNGLYFLLGNVGGNTVNAGDDYKLNVVGNSFMLEVVTPSQAVPEYAEINGGIYGVKKIGSQYYTTEDYQGAFKTNFGNKQMYDVVPANTAGKCNFIYQGNEKGIMYRLHPYKTNSGGEYSSFIDEFNASVYPWRLPKNSDSIYSTNCTYLKNTLNFDKFGYATCLSYGSSIGINSYDRQSQWGYWFVNNNSLSVLYNYDDNSTPSALGAGDNFVRIRLCRDV